MLGLRACMSRMFAAAISIAAGIVNLLESGKIAWLGELGAAGEKSQIVRPVVLRVGEQRQLT